MKSDGFFSSDEEQDIIPVKEKISDKSIIAYMYIDYDKYYYKDWHSFPENIVDLKSLMINPCWNDFFENVDMEDIEKEISRLVVKKKNILPTADLVFNAFNFLSPKKIKVVICGQDPYPGSCQNTHIPYATGNSFSVPRKTTIPGSLNNIFKNMLSYGHIKKIPDNGSLSNWVMQGCFMINSALTTVDGTRNAHQDLWKSFTNQLFKFINDNMKDIIFVAWGRDAHSLIKSTIDSKKHYIITSSHPSPLSCHKTFLGHNYETYQMMVYSSFNDVDHFGLINQHLKKSGKEEILWDILDIERYY